MKECHSGRHGTRIVHMSVMTIQPEPTLDSSSRGQLIRSVAARWGVAVQRRGLSRGASPVRQLSLQPVATGAAAAGNEAARSLWCKGSFSDPASVQAVT